MAGWWAVGVRRTGNRSVLSGVLAAFVGALIGTTRGRTRARFNGGLRRMLGRFVTGIGDSFRGRYLL